MSNPLDPDLMSTAERPEEAACCLGRPDSHGHRGPSRRLAGRPLPGAAQFSMVSPEFPGRRHRPPRERGRVRLLLVRLLGRGPTRVGGRPRPGAPSVRTSTR